MSSYLPIISLDKGHFSHQIYHKIKLSLLFIIPLLISLNGALFQIDKLTTRASQLANVEQLTNLTVEIRHLLHNLQKERGYTGVFVSTKGRKFKAELLEQRTFTRISTNNINNLLTTQSFTTNKKLEERLKKVNVHLAEIENVRHQVDSLSISEVKAIESYSELNHMLLNVVTSIVQLTVDSELTQAFSAYALFLKGKESVAIERAKFSLVFARGHFLENEYNALVKLELEQALFFNEFTEMTSGGLQQSFGKLFTEKAFQSVQQIKTNALVNNKVNINVMHWFNTITNKIDKLALLGDKISLGLIANASRLKQSSERERLYWLIGLIILYIIIIGSGILLIAHIHRTEMNRIEEYQNLFSKNSAAMIVINAQSQDVLYGNQSFSDLLGYNQEQLSTLNLTNFHRKEDFDRLLSLFKRMVTGEISSTEKVLFIRNNDDVFFADIFAFPITIDKQEYVAAHIVDITSKLQAKQYIEQSELTLQMILDSLSSAVVVLEGKNQIPIYMNKKAIEIYKNKGEKESVWSLFEQSFLSNFNDDLISKKEYYSKSKQRWYQITSNLIDWGDGRIVCLKMLKDITESCDAERRNKNLLAENRQLLCRNFLLIEQERKYIAKELHDELGQLLTGIKLQADYISRQTNIEHELIKTSAKSIVQATSELIKSSRDITNNLRPIILDQLGVIDAIKELVQNWRDLNNHVKFELNIESLPHQLNDEFQISVYRIVQEGITNACKHAEAHNIKISLKFISSSHDENRFLLQLKIQDDGKGFAQNSENSKGMGVINMRERTETLNGVFCLINRQKQGAEVFITIPLEPVVQEELCQ